jgi:protein arginine N-methyltransferase 7
MESMFMFVYRSQCQRVCVVAVLQCAIKAPKHYMHRTLPDSPRMSSWWAATTAAVQAVRSTGKTPRVLLLGAKAGVLAVAALRAGAVHVTCVERYVQACTV